MSVTREELGRRIRAARESCGLTQEQLGDATDLSRVAIGQIESGTRSVASIELNRISYALGRDIKSFFDETFAERDALSALFRADDELANQEQLLVALRDSLKLGHEMTNLERLLRIGQSKALTAAHDPPPPKSRWEAIQQGVKVAVEERQRLGQPVAPLGDLAEVLESQGVRTAAVALPDNISGLTLSDSKIGMFVVINTSHASVRCRFSMAHEYAHVLLDRSRFGAISRAENREDLLEVRANAFAAEFLMPAEGVVQFVAGLGKGGQSRAQVAVFDEDEVLEVEQRAVPGSQDIQLYDVALLAHHFGVSRISAIWRLKNLKLIDGPELQRLREADASEGATVASFLAAEPADRTEAKEDFRRRFLGLALEAYRREEITRNKLVELASMVGIDRVEATKAITSLGLD